MTGRAWLARLAGVKGKRMGTPWYQADHQRCHDRYADKDNDNEPAAVDWRQQPAPTPDHAFSPRTTTLQYLIYSIGAFASRPRDRHENPARALRTDWPLD